ncbi:Mannan polymerase II complex anp1 subunit [Rhizopus stolonifer]|uniref:Mannan polymerase II complex anp1 subunit n=1 Tax=Rhizopus stolonifer TaxID=4846 RepID=A0A367KVD2_RHIST|nr:Mannan polymerase II complex anp1 subunit [Rhizopus stolonifer]
MTKRLVLVILSLFFVVTFYSLSQHGCKRTARIVRESMALTQQVPFSSQQAKYMNLNNMSQEHVLILTPLKNAEPYLDRYFELLDSLDYPKHLISLAFLVSDTTDNTMDMLYQHANAYHRMDIFVKDFSYRLPQSNRHGFDIQPLRRSFMARSRNYLLTAALREEHSWVLWLDVDIVQYPTHILKDLQSLNLDIVVPNCLKYTEDGSFWGYDKNNWQETVESIALQQSLDTVKSFFV